MWSNIMKTATNLVEEARDVVEDAIQGDDLSDDDYSDDGSTYEEGGEPAGGDGRRRYD